MSIENAARTLEDINELQVQCLNLVKLIDAILNFTVKTKVHLIDCHI